MLHSLEVGVDPNDEEQPYSYSQTHSSVLHIQSGPRAGAVAVGISRPGPTAPNWLYEPPVSDRVLTFLQKEYDKTKTQRDQEEKLIVSAWYNMVSGDAVVWGGRVEQGDAFVLTGHTQNAGLGLSVNIYGLSELLSLSPCQSLTGVARTQNRLFL